MADKKYTIRGRIVDSKTKKGITALRVEAWDKDLIFDDLVLRARAKIT